ncbi:substrate-binding domain-containing protein [Lachnospiraceae bacterium 62-35]
MKGKKIQRLACVLLAALLTVGCYGDSKKKPLESSKDSSRKERQGKNPEAEGEEALLEKDAYGWEEIPIEARSSKFNLSEEARKGIPVLSKEEYPMVDGSTATIPLSQGMYCLSTGATQDEAEQDIIHNKTTESYYRLLRGDVDLVIAYEPPQAFYEDMKKSDKKLDIRPIGRDALVFLANEGNPVESLTGQQLLDIYSGKISNWSEVGGRDREIAAFQRPSGSGSQTLMEKLVMKDVPMSKARAAWVATEMGELVDRVASYNNEENALGYSVYFYARNMYEQPGLRFMGVDGVIPDNQTIKSGEYPYVNEFYAAIQKNASKDSPEYKLFTWLTEDEGQAFIESLGYVAVKEIEHFSGERLEAESEKETFDGWIKLEDNERLLIDGEYGIGTPGTLLLDQDAGHMTYIRDYILKEEKAVDIIDIGKPVQVLKKLPDYGRFCGIRDIPGKKWMIPPEYDDIYEMNNGLYQAIRSSDGVADYYDKNYSLIASLPSEGYTSNETEHYLWRVHMEENKAEIYDLKGKQTAEIDFSPYGNVQYLFTGPICQVNFEEKKMAAFREDGTFYYDISMVPDEICHSIEIEVEELKDAGSSGDDRIRLVSILDSGKVAILGKGSQNFAYDVEEKKLLTHAGDSVWAYGKAISVSNDEESWILDTDGKAMKSQSGIPFEKISTYMDCFCCYAALEDRIIIQDERGKEYTYLGSFGETPDVFHPHEGVFIIVVTPDWEGNGEAYVYEENELRMGGNGVMASPYEGGISAWNPHTGERISYEDDGTVWTQFDDEEWSMLKDSRAKAVVRGVYLYILDEQDRVVFKTISGNLAE